MIGDRDLFFTIKIAIDDRHFEFFLGKWRKMATLRNYKQQEVIQFPLQSVS